MRRPSLCISFLAFILFATSAFPARDCDSQLRRVALRFKPNFIVAADDTVSLGEISLELSDEVTAEEATRFFVHGEELPPDLLSAIQSQLNLGLRDIPLQAVLPSFARVHTQASCPVDGPNCWNATLNWFKNGLIEPTTQGQMLNWIKKNCRNLPSNEVPEYGDVISFWGHERLSWEYDLSNPPRPQLLHTAIFIRDDFMWHKMGLRKELPWTFARISSYLATFKNMEQELDVLYHRCEPRN